MYLRFVTKRIDEDSLQPKGVFVASYELLDSGELTQDEWGRVRSILDWFNNNLPHPPDNSKLPRAIYWFKANSEECISKVWELVHLLREHGHFVDVHKRRTLASIVYEDRYQVAAFVSKLDGKLNVK
jgi:hypothetical protein